MSMLPPPKQQADPLSGSSSRSDGLRIYQTWKGNNKFILEGRLVFGPDVRKLGGTVFLILAPVAVFCGFVARNLGISIMVVVIVFTIYVLVLLQLTSGRDPGIIPRNAHPPELERYDGSAEGSARTPHRRLPRIKEVEVNGVNVNIKYCDTCMLYRPPRCSHCSICNNCVERFDHHCPWIGQCIGLRNYRYYFMFVLSTTLLWIYMFGFCWVYITRIMNGEQTTVWKAMIKTPASVVLIVYTFTSLWFVGGLTTFHSYLISTNQTTYEYLRHGRYDPGSHPYNKGVVQNLSEILWSSVPSSKNKFRAKVASEDILPAAGVSATAYIGKGAEGVDDNEMGRKAAWIDFGLLTDNMMKMVVNTLRMMVWWYWWRRRTVTRDESQCEGGGDDTGMHSS